jgi:hypothetical protein
MALPDTITITAVQTVGSVAVNTVQNVGVINLEDNAPDLTIQVSNVEPSSMVQSVNGKIGHVVLDYPDINVSPVNHVKYVHTQSAVSNDWTITHNLGYFPNVTILDNENPPRIVEADIRYLNTSSVRIIMNTSMSGTAYLS